MKIIECPKTSHIVVEFQDEYKTKAYTNYSNFLSGSIKNPYYPSVYGVGITGAKYPRSINKKMTKEYDTWIHMLQRCYDEKKKENQPTYKDVTCCDEWLNYENFYEWLHSQDNFDKWFNEKYWALDKDIIKKRNKVYSPDTCCLVPQNVNCLFLKREAERGKYPIGVRYSDYGFITKCSNPFTGKNEEIGWYNTSEGAFTWGYKPYKENIIKQVAQIEFEKGNITEKCYNAMMNYIVEIDD